LALVDVWHWSLTIDEVIGSIRVDHDASGSDSINLLGQYLSKYLGSATVLTIKDCVTDHMGFRIAFLTGPQTEKAE
jgi:hypothetical protein